MPTFTSSDGVSLHFTMSGPDTGPAVVLVAGFTAPATSWILVERALVDAGHRIIAFDRRSHGESESPHHGQRMARHGQDLAELLALLDLQEAVLVGGSMGASTIWAFVDLHGTERVRSIVSVDQTPRMVNDGDWQNGFYGLSLDNVGTFFANGIPATGRGLPGSASLPGLQRLVAELGSMPAMGDAGAPQTVPLLRDHAAQDWRDVIARVDVPVLMVAGAQSQFWPAEHATAVATLNPRVQAVVLEEAGHAVNLDQPEEFNRVVLEFLR